MSDRFGVEIYHRYTICMVFTYRERCSTPALQDAATAVLSRGESGHLLGLPPDYLFLTGDANSALLLSQLVLLVNTHLQPRRLGLQEATQTNTDGQGLEPTD